MFIWSVKAKTEIQKVEPSLFHSLNEVVRWNNDVYKKWKELYVKVVISFFKEIYTIHVILWAQILQWHGEQTVGCTKLREGKVSFYSLIMKFCGNLSIFLNYDPKSCYGTK